MKKDEQKNWSRGYKKALADVTDLCGDLLKRQWEGDIREKVEDGYRARNWNLSAYTERDNQIQQLLDTIKNALSDPKGCATRELEIACEEPHKLLFDEALLLGVKKAEIYWQINENVWKKR